MKENIKAGVIGLVKGAISSIPVAGPLLTSVYEEVVTVSLNERRQEWESLMETRLEEIGEGVLDKLRDNERFVTCLVQATQYVMRTHQDEKMLLFSNVVLNSIYPSSITDDKMLMFLNWLNKYTVTHIRLLDFLDDPKKHAIRMGINIDRYYMGGTETVLRDTYPELISPSDNMHNIVIHELYNDGLLNTDGIGTMMTRDGMLASRTSKIGKEFITFLTAPEYGSDC